MEDFLSTAKINDIFYLNHSCHLTREIQDRFEFKKDDLNIGEIKYKIIFSLSKKSIFEKLIFFLTHDIDQIDF